MALMKVRTSGAAVVPVPVSDFKPAELAAALGDDTEALIIRNKETLGVYMSVEHRNAIAEDKEKLQDALLIIDMLSAGRSFDDIKRSVQDVAAGRITSADDFLAELKG